LAIRVEPASGVIVLDQVLDYGNIVAALTASYMTGSKLHFGHLTTKVARVFHFLSGEVDVIEVS
jgi:hypothetical protein